MRFCDYIIILTFSELVHAKELLSTETLFGPIWNFTQYCGTYRDSRRLLHDDEVSENLLNGSRINELSNVFDNGEVNKLIYDFIVAKNSLSLVCSSNSWSYADDSVKDLANPTKDDPLDCECQLDKVLGKISYASSQELSTPSGSCSTKNEHDYLIQIDSFGRVTDGPSYFNDRWLGDYDKCTHMKQMRYCFGSYKTSDWLSSDLQRDDFRGLRIGLCLPRTCGFDTLQNRVILSKVNSLAQKNLINLFDFKSQFSLDDIYCPPTVDSRWMSMTKDHMSIFLLLVMLIWLVLLSYASFTSTISSDTRTLKDFDIKHRLVSFFHNDKLNSKLCGINAIKVIAMIWLICSHSLIGLMPFQRNYTDIKSDSFIAGLLLQGHHAVPIFFLISGLLVGQKHLYKKQDSIRLIAYRYLRLAPMYLVIYAYVKKFSHLLGSGPLWDYGVSPQSEARQCMLESWFLPVFMLANFVNPFSHCILTGWHISNDFQIYLILPLIFYIYGKSKRFGRLSVFFGFIISHAHHYWYYLRSDRFDSRQLLSQSFFFGPRIVIDRLAFDYVNPFGRVGNYLLGVLLADLLLEENSKSEYQGREIYREIQIDRDDTKYSDNSETPTLGGREQELSGSLFMRRNSFFDRVWQSIKSNQSLSAGLFCLMYTLSYPTSPESIKKVHYENRIKDVLFPFSRIVVEFGYFFVLHHIIIHSRRDPAATNKFQVGYRLAKRPKKSPESLGTFEGSKQLANEFTNVRQPGRIQCFFGLSFWDVLVKLNYSIILTHYTVVRYVVQSQRQLPIFNAMNLSKNLLLIVTLSYLVSFVIHIFVEMPLTNIIKRLVSRVDERYK